MWIQIDPLAPEPLFRQVCAGVKAAVARGRLKQGDRLPSVRELAQELAINPNTVSKAYAELEHEGVIVRRQGAGCFVHGATPARSDQSRRRTLEQLAEKLAIEAFHLGLEGGDVRAALERALAELPQGDEQRQPGESAQLGSAAPNMQAPDAGIPKSNQPRPGEHRQAS